LLSLAAKKATARAPTEDSSKATASSHYSFFCYLQPPRQQPATAALDPRGRKEEQKSKRKKEDREQI
jgi:hypothetical protein